MKIKRLLIIAAAIAAGCFTQQAQAKIWRVNNNANATNGSNFGGTVAYPVFQQLFGTSTNSASGSNLVQNGDTVHLEGSTTEYAGGGNLTKRLVIIGPGYFLDENPITSNNVLPSIIGTINFMTGSSGSQLIGVDLTGFNSGTNVYVSNILIKRCKIESPIYLPTGTSDIKILQNFFSTASTNSIITTSGAPGFPTDVIFNNNIVLSTLVLPVGYAMLECNNNVFAGPSIAGQPSLRMYVGSFQNNIMTNPAATVNINGGTNMNVTYNTGASAAQFGTSNGNVVVADMTTLFVSPGTSDGKYQLKPGSAAGSDFTDRGAFGGAAVTSRYSLSGLAAIPVIYNINTPSGTSGNLQVTIQARTIK